MNIELIKSNFEDYINSERCKVDLWDQSQEGYVLEVLESGWRVLLPSSIGNGYRSEGVTVILPVLAEEDQGLDLEDCCFDELLEELSQKFEEALEEALDDFRLGC